MCVFYLSHIVLKCLLSFSQACDPLMPLHIVCNHGDAVAVQMLLEHGADVTAAGVSVYVCMGQWEGVTAAGVSVYVCIGQWEGSLQLGSMCCVCRQVGGVTAAGVSVCVCV